MTLSNLPSFGKSTSPIWLRTDFTLYRNSSAYKFSNKLESEEKESLSRALLGLFPNEVPLCSKEATPQEREYALDHLFQLGRYSLMTPEYTAAIGRGDHLTLSTTSYSPNWEKAWATLKRLDSSFCSKFAPAFSEHYGFLTASPSSCGLALTVSSILHIPALLLFDMLDTPEGITIKGVETDEPLGGFVIMQSGLTLGKSEDDVLKGMHSASRSLVIAEKRLRDQIKIDSPKQVTNEVQRAFALLRYSSLLEIRETLSAIGMIKLGCDLGWVTSITDSEINELYFTVKRSYLLTIESDINLVPATRAQLMHKYLQNASIQTGL